MSIICIPINIDTFEIDQKSLINQDFYWASDIKRRGVIKKKPNFNIDYYIVIRDYNIYTCDKSRVEELLKASAVYYNSVKTFLRTKKMMKFL